MGEESILINPKDIKREPRKKEKDNKEEKYRLKGNLVEINFESKARFSLPEDMFFEDYSVEDVQEFAVTDIEDLLEAEVVILDKLKNQDCNVSVAKATPNEFLEILIGMKTKFDVANYTHHWVCECQAMRQEEEQIINETVINLGKIRFKSIEEVDENFRNKFKEVFDSMSDEQFKNYLKQRYGANSPEVNIRTREIELSEIKVKEPIYYENQKDNRIYGFNLMRIENVLKAHKMINEKYRPLIKSIHNRKNNGKPLDVFKAEKEEELNKINRKKAKEIITYAEGLTLVIIDGKEINSDNEKIELYKKLKRDDYFDLENFLKDIDYGVHYDEKLSCPICGKAEGRVLQQNINPYELLPLDPDSKIKSIGGDNRRSNIYFGL